MVPVLLWLAPKLALYLAMRDQEVNNSELARRLGVHERVLRRMLDPEHATKAEKIQAALAALVKQMTVEVRDATQNGEGAGHR
jgi:antitoxin HicB